MPFFADVIRGCYVRIGIGQHEGRMIYRVNCHVLIDISSCTLYMCTYIRCVRL